MTIPFYKPHVFGNEIIHIQEAIHFNKLSGDGPFTKKASIFFEEKYGINRALLTTSCTDALEMAAILLDIKPGDEVIMPSFTFVSTANAFVLRGARVIFADSSENSPNIDPACVESLITKRTKAIVIVHYAGIACDMDQFIDIQNRYGIPLVEDAAQAIDSFYDSKPLGGIGCLGTFSFHETKNVVAGEGGLLCVNNKSLVHRAEVIREKGTNRRAFLRGEVDKYSWCDLGSSFLPSDLTAAFLYGQFENLDAIQEQRKKIWDFYDSRIRTLSLKVKQFEVPFLPDFATHNAHMYYLVCHSLDSRNGLLKKFGDKGINATFHYNSLHSSVYYKAQHDGRPLLQSDRYTDGLIRLPLYHELTEIQLDSICSIIEDYFT